MEKLNINVTKYDFRLNGKSVMNIILDLNDNETFLTTELMNICQSYCNSAWSRVLMTIEPLNKSVFTRSVIVATYENGNRKISIQNQTVKMVKEK